MRHLAGAEDGQNGIRNTSALRLLNVTGGISRGKTLVVPSGLWVATAPRRDTSIDGLIAWAWKNRRADILAQFGIYVTFDL